MAEKTDEQIAKDNSTTIDALGVYLDDVAPAEQFGSNPLHRIGNIQPIQSQEDLFERGLIGEDGLLTPKGDLYKTLSDNGLINTDGTLPKKSVAFMMDEDDALDRENLDAYVIRRENKIGEKPMSWGDTFGGLGELLWDAGAGLGTMVKLGIQNIGVRDIAYTDPLGISSIPASEEKLQEIQKRKDQLLNKSSIAATSFVENSIKAFSETGAIVNLAGAAVSSIPARIMGDEKIASDQVNAARQAQDRLIKSNQDAAIGSTLDAVFQTATYVPEMARVKSEMPKAEFDKIIKQTGAAGQIFADPVELAKIGTVMKLATQPIVSRLTLNAERVIGKASDRAARLAEINVEIADVERAKGMTQNAAELARKTADAARERFDLNGDQLLLQRANAAEEIFNRSTAKVGQFTDDGVRLANEAAELTAETQKLASRIPVAAAQAFEATAKAGRELKAVPFKVFAATIEPVSRGLIALDDGLDAVSKKLGIGAAYDIMTSKVGQAVGYGAAIGLGPAPALIGAAGSVLKSGPFLQRLADTSRILGTEMAKAQSQVPFFQRVANNPMISPAHRSLAHLSDLATLGGFLPDITRRAAKGAAVSFPLDFAAQYMSDGGEINQNTFKQAFAESVLIGGSSAALGGMFAGTKQRHRDLAVNDEINFRNEITAPDQKQLFTSAPSGIRRAVGTFAAVFPSVNIQFTQEGGGFHDDNTIGIDLNSSNPLKYLLAHEVKHLLVHRNQMHTPIVAMMLGDGEAGGLMRAPDGTLNPEFEAFAREYNNRQIAAGRAPVSLGKIAEEFFVEAGVEDMSRMSESGELGAIASRTEARRMIGRLFNSVFDKSTVLKDFHLHIGGLMDQGGKLVQGNGLLNPGITQTQEMRNMTRNMLKRAAGRSVGQFEPLGAAEAGNKGEGPGINLPINPDDKAMIEKIGPVMFEMETVNGRRQVVRDSDGNPVPVDFNTQLMRSRTGALIQEAIGNRPSTYQSSPNEMRLNDEGIWEGYLPPDIIEFIKKKGSLNQEQIRMIEHVNSMIKNFKGDVALVINHPATSRNKKGKLNYKTLKATLRQVVPISWNLTKDGNLTLGLMSVTQLKSNIDARISSRLGQQLYQGNRAKLMVDIGKVMELHQQGKRTDEYFDTEYGAAKSQQFKNFVNSVFGLMTKKQGEANPIFSEENLRGNGVYKTYRADRISQATKMTGDKYPFQYDFVVQNMMPNGLPTLDDQGRPVAMNRLPEPAGTNGIAQGSGISQNQQETNGNQQPEIQAQPVSAGTGGPETQGGGLRGQGGLPRGTEQLQPLYSPRDSGIPLEGLPATVKVPGLGRVTFGPNETARQVAADYAKSVGIDYNPPKQYAEVDEARATRIAAEYDKMPHAPNDPKVKASYDAMIKETLAQWEAIKKTGLKVEAIPAGAPNPYEASPRLAVMDVNENNHLWFFPTEEGFGTAETADIDISGNPLMAPTGEILNGHKMLANDVFRVVHDYFGHIKEGVGFRADGEENAWRSHSAMYSDLARPAMTAETRGQNSWVNYGPYGEHNRKAKGDTIYAPQKTGIMPDWVMSEGAGDTNRLPEPTKKKEEIVEPEDKGIQAPTGSLGELRSNVEIKKSNLPSDALSVPKFVARENKDSDWKVMEGPLRIARGNYFTPLPNIKIKKTNEFSVQNQNLVQNAFLAKSKTPTDPKALREQQNAIRNTNASLDKIGSAVRDIEADPQKFVDPKGYAEVMKKAGVTGDVLIPPSSLKMMLEDPDAFTALLSGGYHGDKTVAGIRESAMSGLDSVVEMRKLIGGRPPDLVTAIHHLWGTLSKQLPPLQQEALWMRMITNKEVMQQIGESINGTFSQSPSQWKDTVKKARINTVGNYGKLGNNATSNANSFYLMLYRHNGKWGEVSDVYKNNDAVQMRYDFNTLGHGATGIKNKVQSFIGLTFGIKGNVLDRWRFVDMYLADAMKITGEKTPRDYFKYEGKSKNVPVDKIGIYKNYGTIENKSPLFSLAMYSGMDRVSQAAIDASPSLKALLGNHADPGGLHWLSWNAIKNEAVGHSSLDITKNFIKAYNQDGKFDKLTVDNFLKFVNSTEAFVEGTSGGGEEITRLTLKNGVFNYTKK